MLVDTLVKEAQGLPEDMVMNIVRYTRFLKSEYGAQPVREMTKNDGWYRKPGLLKGQIVMSDDFDEPLDDFAEYM